MLGAPALDLQLQGQLGFAAEVRHDLRARRPPLDMESKHLFNTVLLFFGRSQRMRGKKQKTHRSINTKYQGPHVGPTHNTNRHAMHIVSP